MLPHENDEETMVQQWNNIHDSNLVTMSKRERAHSGVVKQDSEDIYLLIAEERERACGGMVEG